MEARLAQRFARTFRMADAGNERPAPRRILIVEDNELNRRLLNDVLEAHGYDVRQCTEGKPVLALARHFRPHLILMDIQLPDISGLEACRQLKDDPETRDIPVVAVTAFAMAGDEGKARAVGCEAYLTKPIRLREFLDTVEQFTAGVTGFGCAVPVRRPDNDS
jgi:two-component system cell cycle response regulator DivK